MVRDEIQIAAEREYAVRKARTEARAEARAEALAEGRAEGRTEGRAEEKIDTARKLKQAGVDIAIISQCTGLSVEEVQAL